MRGSIAVHASPGALALFDVNGDGRLDLIVGGASFGLWLGDGAGGFSSASTSPLHGPKGAEDFAFGDFDEDGRVDIVVAEHDQQPRFFLFRATSAAAFEATPASPFIVDATPHLHTIASCDLDGDGHLDVITDSWPQSRLVLVSGRGDGTFATPGKQIRVPRVPICNLRVTDMNADGHADIVTPAHDSEGVAVLLAGGHGQFQQAIDSPFGSFGGFSKLVLGDVDRDGDADVIEAHRSDPSTEFKRDALSILLNDGAGRLAHAPGSPILDLPAGAANVALGDTNGDGWLDAATVSDRAGAVTLIRGQDSRRGQAMMTLAGDTGLGLRPGGVAIGDLDGDGRAEVVISDSGGARVLILTEAP